MATNLFTVDDGLTETLKTFALIRSLRGRDMLGSMRWIMKEWVSGAIDAIEGTSRARILADLSKRVHAAQKVKALSFVDPFNTSLAKARKIGLIDRWRGTLAAAIVAIYNIGGARGQSAVAFYNAVNKWAQRKAFSANLHKAGLYKARRELHIASGAEPAKLMHAPGDYKETVTDEAADLLAENWASAGNPDALGITGLAGNAFEISAKSIQAKFEKHLRDQFSRAAVEAGFRVASAAAA